MPSDLVRDILRRILKPRWYDRVLFFPQRRLSDEQRRFLANYVAILDSMTPKERERPNVIDDSRTSRIVIGSGVDPTIAGAILRGLKRSSYRRGTDSADN
ncbi:hypothetical protein [Stieleria varia]|uniref:Signal recognition particle protein n=1 Tax=Stieleria varia TaxID=2528005 RepID=A0A5C6AG11_9BACT|nr:signal recognition particle protein [Stieleria varia]